MSDRKEKRLRIVIFLVIASMVTISLIAFNYTQKVKATSLQITYTKDVLLRLNDLYNTVIGHAGSARRYSLDGNEADMRDMQSTALLLQSKLTTMRSELLNKASKQRLLDSLEKYIQKRIEYSNEIITAGNEKGLAAATNLYQTGIGREYNNLVFGFINQIQATELTNLQSSEQRNTIAGTKLSYYLLGLLVFALALVIFIIQKIRMDVAEREKTEQQLKEFNEKLEDQVKLKTAEIKKSEARLEASEKNLQWVLSSTVENFYVVDKNFRVTLINTAAQKNLAKAWGAEVTAGTNILQNIPEERRESIKMNFEKAFNGQKIEYEITNYLPGLPAWGIVSFVPVFNNKGDVTGACVLTIDVSERKKAEKEKDQINYLLNERIKELITLQRVSQLLQAENKPIEILLKEIVSRLPAGWQYPEITEARISWGDKVFASPGYNESPYKQVAAFQSSDGVTGAIEVMYLEKKPDFDEGPFLKEERNLINTLAEMLQNYFDRKHTEKKLNQSYQEIRQLASYIEQAREEEKIRIAREIHDDLGQQLTGLKMDLSWLKGKLNLTDEVLQKKVEDMKELLDETVRSVRRIASDLRPGVLDDLGLVAAIKWQSSEFEKRSGISTRFNANSGDVELEPVVSTGLFRIFQESLTNIARHSHAGKVTASLDKLDGEVILTIIDDGVGFNISSIRQKRTLGLLGMKERTALMGGKCEIFSVEGGGTSVKVTVPVHA